MWGSRGLDDDNYDEYDEDDNDDDRHNCGSANDDITNNAMMEFISFHFTTESSDDFHPSILNPCLLVSTLVILCRIIEQNSWHRNFSPTFVFIISSSFPCPVCVRWFWYFRNKCYFTNILIFSFNLQLIVNVRKFKKRISRITWTYLLGGATAQVSQFPCKGAAATTGHKIQVSRQLLHVKISTFLLYDLLFPHI